MSDYITSSAEFSEYQIETNVENRCAGSNSKYFACICQEERRKTMTYVMNAGVRDEISTQELPNMK